MGLFRRNKTERKTTRKRKEKSRFYNKDGFKHLKIVGARTTYTMIFLPLSVYITFSANDVEHWMVLDVNDRLTGTMPKDQLEKYFDRMSNYLENDPKNRQNLEDQWSEIVERNKVWTLGDTFLRGWFND